MVPNIESYPSQHPDRVRKRGTIRELLIRQRPHEVTLNQRDSVKLCMQHSDFCVAVNRQYTPGAKGRRQTSKPMKIEQFPRKVNVCLRAQWFLLLQPLKRAILIHCNTGRMLVLCTLLYDDRGSVLIPDPKKFHMD